jgi:hypothetical protein
MAAGLRLERQHRRAPQPRSIWEVPGRAADLHLKPLNVRDDQLWRQAPLTAVDRTAAAGGAGKGILDLLRLCWPIHRRGNEVVHHVEVSSVPNWVNTDMVRLIRREGGRLTLTTPPRPLGGDMSTFELVWERVD